jgi:hypothetical protein
VEQTHEPMYKHRIRGIRCRTSWQVTTKSISIKGTGCKFGGCVRKVVELTSGDLSLVPETGLRVERSILTGRQKSAEGVVAKTARESGKERRPERSPQGVDGSGK